MSNFKIADLDLEVSLTESEVNSIVGGFSFDGMPKKRRPSYYSNNFQSQLNITSGQTNQGNRAKQDNVFVVNFY